MDLKKKKMGAGASLTVSEGGASAGGAVHDNIAEQMEALVRKHYKTNPGETKQIVTRCFDQITSLSRFTPPEANIVESSFNEMDVNGNGRISLAEIDKLIVEKYPTFNNKPALMRAYKAADADDDGLINRKEFKRLWAYIAYFNNLWHKFSVFDHNQDRKINRTEFETLSKDLFGAKFGSVSEADYLFELIDTNGGGEITFTEFCSFMVKRTVALQ